MASTKSKYRLLVGFTNPDEFEAQVNILGDLGYSAVQSGEIGGKLWALMRLENGSYQDVTNLKDVDPLEVDAHIAMGWEITSTSISTKFIRMIKRRAEAPELKQLRNIQDRETMHTAPEERVLISPELRRLSK